MLVTWGPVLLAALVVVLGFATGLLDKQRVFVDIAHTDMVFEDDDRRLSLEEGDSYGILPCIGPYYELPRGTYRLQWHMDADGANKIHLDSTNGALMDPQVVELPQGEWEGEFEFTVVEARQEPANQCRVLLRHVHGAALAAHVQPVLQGQRLYAAVCRRGIQRPVAAVCLWTDDPAQCCRSRSRRPGGAGVSALRSRRR